MVADGNDSNDGAPTPSVCNSKQSAKECVPCSTLDSSSVLPIEEVKRRVSETLPLWTVMTSSPDVTCYLARAFTAKNFQAALDAINDAGTVAELESHHPNFHLTNYREVSIEIWTHKVQGVTANDLTLAQKLDGQVRIDYSPKWLRSHPEAKSTAK